LNGKWKEKGVNGMKKCFAVCCLIFLTLLVWSGSIIYELKLDLKIQTKDSQEAYLCNLLNVRRIGGVLVGLEDIEKESWWIVRDDYLHLLGMTAEDESAIPQEALDSMNSPQAQALLYGLIWETYGDLPQTAEGFRTDSESFGGRYTYQTIEILQDIPEEDTQSLKAFLNAIEEDTRTESLVQNLQKWKEEQNP
jgi:hypothetical protein